jgi:hypothetical protein
LALGSMSFESSVRALYAISISWNTPKYTPKNYALSTNAVGRY